MDVISYGAATQAGKEEKKTRDLLGQDVKGSHSNVKERIDKIEKSIQAVVEKANKLIINDTINIMKANAKLNAIAKTTKYKMHNMIFDDLLDLSGIDTTKSSGYKHDAVNGLITGGTIVTKVEDADTVPTKAILAIEENTVPLKGSYSISRDGGTTWESITPDTLFYFADSISPLNKNLCVKAVLPVGTQLLNYALTWV